MWSRNASYQSPLARNSYKSVALKFSMGSLTQMASTVSSLWPRRLIPAGLLERELPVESRIIGDQSDAR